MGSRRKSTNYCYFSYWWVKLGYEGGFTGFSLAAATSFSALMNRPEQALGNLTQLLATWVEPNTLYSEGSPVIETPLAAARSIHDMILQSWNGTIKVFPSVPSSWVNITFWNLLAEGAFLISSQLQNSNVQFVQITSLAGEPCIIQVDIQPPLQVTPSFISVTQLGNNLYQVSLTKEEIVLITPKGSTTNFNLEPVIGNSTQFNYWGYHKGGNNVH